MKWPIAFLMNILFLILFTPLSCFIVFLTMPAASLQELVFWKWNASHPEASLDGIHYWFGADDGCSSCLWLPEPLRAFLLQDNNKQQKARKNPRTGSTLFLCMPGTPYRIHTRAAPFSFISLGYCGMLFDPYFTPWKGSEHISLSTVHTLSKGAVLTDVTLAHKEEKTLSLQRTSAAASKIQMVLGTPDLCFAVYILRQQGQPHASWPSTSRLKISLFNQSSCCRCCEKVTAEFVDSPWEISLARFC